MSNNITTDNVFSLIARQAEVMRRVKNGGLPINVALERTQHILDGVYPPKAVFTPPDWYELPEVQIKTTSEFLKQNGNEVGFTADDIPAPPSDFISRTPTEVLMLVVTLPDKGKVKSTQRNFDSKWNFIVPSEGFSKCYLDGLKSGAKFLRYVKGIRKTPGIRWVGFDPEVYIGLSPDQALEQALKDGVTLGSDEVLVAAAVFPKWVKSWNGTKWHYPNMSAYRLYWNAVWRRSPCLVRKDDDRLLKLDADRSDGAYGYWSSCAVREL